MSVPSRSVLVLAGLLGAFVALTVESHAQPAPISYGAPRPAERAYAALPGGDANSYGYGAGRSDGGGVLDLTRPTTRNERDPDLANPPRDVAAVGQGDEQPPRAPQQRPAWLEQERVGPPYEANGRWYVPTPELGYSEIGTASWYGPGFHGQAAANGDGYDQEAMTAAHPTLPLNSLVQVTNLENRREVIVRITDRGPFVGDRLIDVSRRAADVLGFQQSGVTRVHVRYLGPAPRRYGEGEGATPLPAQRQQPAPLAAAAPRAYEAPAAGAVVVQIGAYADLSNAHRVRAAVAHVGDVLVETRDTPRGEVFRVRLVGYESRDAAEAARRQVAALGYPEAVVAAR